MRDIKRSSIITSKMFLNFFMGWHMFMILFLLIFNVSLTAAEPKVNLSDVKKCRNEACQNLLRADSNIQRCPSCRENRKTLIRAAVERGIAKDKKQ